MAKAYIIVTEDVHDPAGFQAYMGEAAKAMADGTAKTPTPARPKAVISAVSSNSPTILGRSRFRSSQSINFRRIAESSPGSNAGSSAMHAGNG